RRRHTRCYRDWSSDVCSSDLFAESQIEACGLDLVGDEVIGSQDGAIACERRDHVVGQDAFLVNCKGQRHDAKSPMTPKYFPPISTQTASSLPGIARPQGRSRPSSTGYGRA